MIVTYGIGIDEDTLGSATTYGFGVKILRPFWEKIRSYALKITRVEEKELKR